MTVDMRATRTRLATAACLLIAVSWSIVGCGGSGSSGFEGVSQAIARAIDDEECVAFEEQMYCASGVEAETEEFEGASVVIQAPDDPLLCDEATAGLACTASLDFTTQGFMVVNSLLAAVSESEKGPWTLVALEATDDVFGPRRVSILVPGQPDATTPSPFIAAVLVYAGVPPEVLPNTAQRLADFGVELVYVSRRLELVVPPGPVKLRALVEHDTVSD